MDYPEAVWLPLTPTGLMIQDTANGLKGLTRTALNPDGAIPSDRYPQTLTNINDITYHRTAVASDLDLTFQWIPEASGKIDKFFINIATIVNMTTDTGGSYTFDSARVTITRVGGDDVLFDQVFPTGLSARTDVDDADLFIIAQPVWGADFKIRAGNPINIRVRTSSTIVATIVFHSGFCPFFPQQIPAGTSDEQYWATSGIMWYISRDQDE